MRLEKPPARYEQVAEARRSLAIEQAFATAFQRDVDCEVGRGRLILTAPNGSRWALLVSNAGVLSTVAL